MSSAIVTRFSLGGASALAAAQTLLLAGTVALVVSTVVGLEGLEAAAATGGVGPVAVLELVAAVLEAVAVAVEEEEEEAAAVD